MAKAGFTFELQSKELEAQIKKALRRNPVMTARKVAACALDLAGESAQRAPIESGDLRNNCNAEINGQTIFDKQQAAPTIVKSLKAEASIGYSLPYALRQHEDLNLRHDRTDGYYRADGTTVNMVAGGESKYLERPFEENKAKYIKMILQIPDEVIK